MTERVREILGWYGSDNPGTLTNLARLLNHGKLAGTGHMVILPAVPQPALLRPERRHGEGQPDQLDLAEECGLFWLPDVGQCPECRQHIGQRRLWPHRWQWGG